MPVVELELTARAAQLLTEAYAVHQTGDTEVTSGILRQALRECPEQALAILWAACLGGAGQIRRGSWLWLAVSLF